MGVLSEDKKWQSIFPGLRQGQESLGGSSQLCFLLGTVPDVRRMTDRRGTRITRALGAVCQAGSQIHMKSKPGRQAVQKKGPKPRSTTNSHLCADFSPSVASWGLLWRLQALVWKKTENYQLLCNSDFNSEAPSLRAMAPTGWNASFFSAHLKGVLSTKGTKTGVWEWICSRPLMSG